MAATGKALKKLKDHPVHKKKPIRELEQLAIELTSPDKIKERFAHLLQDGYRMASDIVDDDETDLLHTLEVEEQHERVKYDTSKACHLPVKLSLQKLAITPPFANSFAKRLKFEYGALHSAIIVGDVVIEWGREELVEPQIHPNFMAEFVANVGDQGEWHEKEGQYQAEMSMANREQDRERKLNIVCEAIDNKALLIDKLIEVIVEYNRNKTYKVFSCNCQDFAREALAALGIKKPIEFNGMLKQRFEELKLGNRKVPNEIQSHENLDLYVEGVKKELGLQDLEYLQCLYFAEHLPKMEKSGDPDNWECGMPMCKSAELDKLIEQQSSPRYRKDKLRATNSQAPLQLQYRSEAPSRDLATAGPNHPTSQVLSNQQHLPQNTPCVNNCGLPGNVDKAGLCPQCYYLEQKTAKANESDTIRVSTTPLRAIKLETQVIEDPNAMKQAQAKDPRKKCPTVDCEFYGTQETSFYCSKCFEANNAPKCDNCDKFFGSSELNGLCYECFLDKTRLDLPPANSAANIATAPTHNQTVPPTQQGTLQQSAGATQDKCYECEHFYANEEYLGLCYGCMLFKTKTESEGFTSQQKKSLSTLSKPSQQPQVPHYTPRYEKCQDHHCNNPKTETGYCDIHSQPLATQDSSTTHYTEQSNCYICTGRDLSDKNEMCPEHKQMVINQMGRNLPVYANYEHRPQESTHSHYQNIPSPLHFDRGEPQVNTAGQLQHQIWPQQYTTDLHTISKGTHQP